MEKSNTIFSYPTGVDEDSYAAVIRRLRRPKGPVDMVLDTDTFATQMLDVKLRVKA